MHKNGEHQASLVMTDNMDDGRIRFGILLTVVSIFDVKNPMETDFRHAFGC